MTFVVTEPCIHCKYTDCASDCPVSCFKEGANMVVIDPTECIDCGACLDSCPVNAIFPDEEVPKKWQEYIELNARLARVWPTIASSKEPLSTAEEFRSVEDKRGLLEQSPAERT